MVFLTTLLFSLFITIIMIPISVRVADRLHLIDVPNARKVHSIPIPRSGGIAMAVGALASIFIWTRFEGFVGWYLVGGGIIIVSGLVDDLRGLGPRTKFLAQIAAALFAIYPGMIRIENLGALLPDGILLPAWISIPLTLITIVGVTNAINLSDGLDGLAGGISLLNFCCIAFLAYLAQDQMILLLSVAMAGAIFGFLRFNTYPASVFMGDTGSQFLGFSAIIFSLKLTQGGTALSPLLPLLLFGLPVLDTIAVMARRLRRGRPLFSADKNHFHHRLMALGLYQTESVLLIYALQAGLMTLALLFRFYTEWLLLAGYLAFSALVIGAFTLADRTGLRIRRFDLIDRIVKGKLRDLREKGSVIKISFRAIELGIPCLLLFTSLVPASVPPVVSYLSLAWIGMVAIVWGFRRESVVLVLTVGLYLFIPYAIYAADTDALYWMTENLTRYYNLSFFLFAVFIVLTMRFSRRKQGFRSTPMDFLVLFIALVVPNLPVVEIRSYQLGLIAAKIIILFFSYEVLMGELRGNYGKVALFTIISAGVFAVKGFM